MQLQCDPNAAPAAPNRQCIGCLCKLVPLLPASVVRCPRCTALVRTAACITCRTQELVLNLYRNGECRQCHRTLMIKAMFDKKNPAAHLQLLRRAKRPWLLSQLKHLWREGARGSLRQQPPTAHLRQLQDVEG